MYLLSYRHLSDFIKQKYDTDDIPLRQLNLNFIDAFDFYLRVDRQMKPHTVSGHIIILKKMTRRAVNQGTLSQPLRYMFQLYGKMQVRRYKIRPAEAEKGK